MTVPNVAALTKLEFAQSRQNGLGASDMAAILGVSDFKTKADILKQKCLKEIDEAEWAIVGEKVNVRKGADLEPLILQKFSEEWCTPVYKPQASYALRDFQFLTINYDGVIMEQGAAIPAEAKFVSSFGGKFWRFGVACIKDNPGFNDTTLTITDVKKRVEFAAQHYGVPGSYYVQLQQQILGLEAPYGYIAALFDKDWKLYIFRIPADPVVHLALKLEGNRTWDKIQSLRRIAWN